MFLGIFSLGLSVWALWLAQSKQYPQQVTECLYALCALLLLSGTLQVTGGMEKLNEQFSAHTKAPVFQKQQTSPLR
jgi:hypothetical protein